MIATSILLLSIVLKTQSLSVIIIIRIVVDMQI